MLKKILALLLLVLIQFAACACMDNNTDNNTSDIIDTNVENSSQPPFTCELDKEQAELVLTYTDGHTVHFTMTDKLFLGGWDNEEYYYVSIGLSWAVYEDTTAVFIPASFMLPERDNILEISRDNGETWQELTVLADDCDITKSVIGFTSQDSIWLLLEGGRAASMAKLRFYKSEDGGNTWTYGDIGDQVDWSPLDYIDFLSADEGYLSIGAGRLGPVPKIYKTVDFGETWVECKVKARIKKGDYFCVDEIRYNGDTLIMSGHLAHDGDKITLTSKDGLTWKQQK